MAESLETNLSVGGSVGIKNQTILSNLTMLNSIFGIKSKQSQTFTKDGIRIPITEISVEPCVITQIKSVSGDGYNSFQFGFGSRISQKFTKPLRGHLKKTGQGNYLPRFLREARLDEDVKDRKIGDKIKADDVLKAGDTIKVTGISKGKGFQGGVKRHGFAGGPRTHGQSDRERAPGAIGQTTTPGRVYKGKRMAGRMGGQQVTVKGLHVVAVDSQKNIVTIEGLVPGRINTPVRIQKV